jgi:hypothetical protein
MPNNAQKTPLARTLEAFGNRKVRGALAQLGQEIPANVVSIASPGTVIVAFQVTNTIYTLPNVEVPIVGYQWARMPIQPGTPGVVMSADYYLGGQSGIGGGSADLSPRGNLAMLVWMPLGSRNWPASADPNAVDLNGPNGVILRDTNSLSRLVITPTSWDAYPPTGQPATVHGDLVVTGKIVGQGNLLLAGNIEAEAGGTYAGNIATSGTVTAGAGTADQVGLATHSHDYDKPTTGSTAPAATTSPNAGT